MFFRKFDSLFSARRGPTWFRWRKSGRRAESDSGGDGLLANPRSRPTPLSAFRTPTSESVGWLLLLFDTEKQRKRKEFLSCTFGAKSTKILRTSFSAGVYAPRRCTGRARSSLCATPWRTRRSPHPLSPRQTRVRIYCAASGGIIIQCALEARINLLVLPASGCVSLLFRKTNHPRNSIFSFSARRFPTWFRWRKSGRRAESESGGDGLLANPRSRPTPLSAFRTPASESVGWLLLLFATEKQGKKFFGTFLKRGKDFGGFCCFSPLKSREKSFSELNVREIFGKSHPAAGCSQYVPT